MRVEAEADVAVAAEAVDAEAAEAEADEVLGRLFKNAGSCACSSLSEELSPTT
jgi:hypothetical protein